MRRVPKQVLGGQQDDVIQVAGVGHRRQGAVGDESAAIVRGRIVGDLGLLLQDPDHREAHAVDFDVGTHRRHGAEQFFLQTGPDHHHLPAVEHIVLGKKPALGDFGPADAAERGVNPRDGVGAGAIPKIDGPETPHFRRNRLDGGNPLAEGVEIMHFEEDPAPGSLAAGLLARLTREDHDKILADLVEGFDQGLLKAVAVGQEQHQRRDPPGDAQNRQRGAEPVVAERVEGFAESMPDHSYLNASTGVSCEARRAG